MRDIVPTCTPPLMQESKTEESVFCVLTVHNGRKTASRLPSTTPHLEQTKTLVRRRVCDSRAPSCAPSSLAFYISITVNM